MKLGQSSYNKYSLLALFASNIADLQLIFRRCWLLYFGILLGGHDYLVGQHMCHVVDPQPAFDAYLPESS